jgi:hypothetical protein
MATNLIDSSTFKKTWQLIRRDNWVVSALCFALEHCRKHFSSQSQPQYSIGMCVIPTDI